MQKIIEELAAQVDASLAGVTSSESLAAFWQEYLSKNGKVPGLMKQLRTVPKEERPAAGKIINEFKGKGEAEDEAAAERREFYRIFWLNNALCPSKQVKQFIAAN